MAADSKKFDRDFALSALAEIKRGAEMIDGIHQKHEATMSKEIRQKMAMMMETMSKEQTALKEYIAAIETLLQSDAPNLKDIKTHAAAIISQFEKMKICLTDAMQLRKRKFNEKEYKVEAEQIKAKIMGLSERKADNFGVRKWQNFFVEKEKRLFG